MKMMKWGLVAVAGLLVLGLEIFAAKDALNEQGETLVRQLWKDLAAANIDGIKKYISPGFQSIHDDGARDCAAQLELIKGLNIKEYDLKNFKTTESGPVIIVTYSVSVKETIDGERLSAKPAQRLSAWLKTDNGWQWILHANLKAIR
jgi:hypothetical protein